MFFIANDTWIADPGSLSCWNISNGIRILFEKHGFDYLGKLGEMSMETYMSIAAREDAEQFIRELVLEAHNFLAAL